MKMESQIRMIALDQIIPNRFQPRLEFNQEDLTKLANSIIEHGIIQPLVLRRVGEKFEIIAGERRYKASQMAGLSAVPAIITELDDNESAEVAIIENTHRKNLSPIEEAKSYKKLLDRRYITQEQLAKRLGTSQSNIANKVRLLALQEPVQEALMEEKISERHARSLLRVQDPIKQVELLNKTIQERWNVRKLDTEIDKVQYEYRTKQDTAGRLTATGDIDINAMEENSMDIGDLSGAYMPHGASYEYQKPTGDGRGGVFHNPLEDEMANMDTSIGLVNSKPYDDDLDYLEDDDEYDVERIDTTELHYNDEATGGGSAGEDESPEGVRVKGVIREEQYKTMEDVIKGVKKILVNAKYNDVPLDYEEFDFDHIYQIILKVKKEEEKK